MKREDLLFAVVLMILAFEVFAFSLNVAVLLGERAGIEAARQLQLDYTDSGVGCTDDCLEPKE